MDAQKVLEKRSEEFRKEGYVVITHPGKDHLPQSLRDLSIDLLARRGKQVIAVQVKSRDELHDLRDYQQLAERLKVEPGWEPELVVFPPEDGEQLPRDGRELGVSEILALTEEASRAFATGATRASFLIAWAAAEAAMREAARHEGIAIDREVPRFLLQTLYTNGIISREDFDQVEHCLHVRNALAHGFAPSSFEAVDVEFLLNYAARLLSPEPVQADS
jgi:uncharacterized protein YutE (UPF0331/DUF86 family)